MTKIYLLTVHSDLTKGVSEELTLKEWEYLNSIGWYGLSWYSLKELLK